VSGGMQKREENTKRGGGKEKIDWQQVDLRERFGIVPLEASFPS